MVASDYIPQSDVSCLIFNSRGAVEIRFKNHTGKNACATICNELTGFRVAQAFLPVLVLIFSQLPDPHLYLAATLRIEVM